MPAVWRRLAVLSGLGLVLLALLVWAFSLSRPAELPAASNALPDVRLPCVSYAPYRRPGHSPLVPGLNIAPELIEADLRLLAQVTNCVRTYGVDRGLDAVPVLARKLGLRVVLGAWIDRDAASNAAQMNRALALSRGYADVIDLLIVGNEVLLRGEQTPAALAELLDLARRTSAVPVAYADVWEFWVRYGEILRPHVDVVAAHILPYWEDEPVGIEQAVEHIVTVNAKIRAIFSPLPVFVGETGWPAAGRQRGAAQPGHSEQTRFVRKLLARQDPNLHYNLVEGFDQPWKRQLEGAVGGYWGVFTADGQQRVTFNGALPADPNWWRLPLAALIGGLLGGLYGLGWRAGIGGALVLSLAGACTLVLALVQWETLAQSARTPLDWMLGGALAVSALLCTASASRRLTYVFAGMYSASAISGLTVVLLICIALNAVALFVDGRYRPLCWPLLAAPGLLLLALAICGERFARRNTVVISLAALLALAAPLLLWQEGLLNMQAWGLASNFLLLVLAVIWLQRPTSAN